MTSSEPFLRLDRVSKSFPLSPDRQLDVLRDVSLEVSTGDTIAILGPSGSGKSTLLNLMGAMDTPSSGEIQFHGKPSQRY